MANTKAALVSLSIARQSSEFTEETQMVYLHALSDLNPDYIALACDALAKQPRAEFGPVMPSVGDIRKEVHKIDRNERLMAKSLEEGDPRTLVRCAICQDTGWRPFHCDGNGSCGRTRAGFADGAFWGKCSYPHSYVERCICRRH